MLIHDIKVRDDSSAQHAGDDPSFTLHHHASAMHALGVEHHNGTFAACDGPQPILNGISHGRVVKDVVAKSALVAPGRRQRRKATAVLGAGPRHAVGIIGFRDVVVCTRQVHAV